MESLGVLIEGQNNKIQIYNIHQKPNKQILFPELNHLFNESNTLTIVAGDWNSKHTTWNSNTENTNGKKLLRHSNIHGYQLVTPTLPTHIPDNRSHQPSIIDFFAVQNTTTSLEATTIPDLSSDHNPVLLKLDKTIHLTEKLHLNYAKANWEKLGQNLENYERTYKEIPLTTDQIEREIQSLTNAIKTEIKICIPKGKNKIGTYELDKKNQRTHQNKTQS